MIVSEEYGYTGLSLLKAKQNEVLSIWTRRVTNVSCRANVRQGKCCWVRTVAFSQVRRFVWRMETTDLFENENHFIDREIHFLIVHTFSFVFVFRLPDLQYIAEIKLFANGFLEARAFAKKLVILYRYAAELLSKQVWNNLSMIKGFNDGFHWNRVSKTRNLRRVQLEQFFSW